MCYQIYGKTYTIIFFFYQKTKCCILKKEEIIKTITQQLHFSKVIDIFIVTFILHESI